MKWGIIVHLGHDNFRTKKLPIKLIILSLVIITVGCFALNQNSKKRVLVEEHKEETKPSSKKIFSTNLSNLEGYYIGLKNKSQKQNSDPIVITYINYEKLTNNDSKAYFSTKLINDTASLEIPNALDELATQPDLINKTFSTLARIADNFFTANMNEGKDGNKLFHDLMLYVPYSPNNYQIFLQIDNDNGETDNYMLVKSTKEELSALEKVPVDKFRDKILTKKLNLLNFDNTERAFYNVASNYVGYKSIPVLE
ncbi:hypothetical protein [Enterococcus faecalis]|uniref:hypothetical protein n=1 Tax=Enterococcus faecalis TaxID=1351 RepID=UPI0032DFCA56